MKNSYAPQRLAFVFFCLLSLFSFNAFAQVGIGTTDPQATLDIAGTYSPAILKTLINEDFSSYTVNQINTPDPDCTSTPAGWVNATTSPYTCTDCLGKFLYIDSDNSNCIQNSQVLIPFNSSPTTSTVAISMNFKYVNGYIGTNRNKDYITIMLYNNTTLTQLVLFSTNNTSVDGILTGAGISVIPGNNYSIRILYYGDFAWGATVDNILVTENVIVTPASYAFKMNDGTAQNGYVLTTDGNGNARWMAPGAAPFSGKGGGGSQMLTLVENNSELVNNVNFPLKENSSDSSSEYPVDSNVIKTDLNFIELRNMLELQQQEINILKKALQELESKTSN